MRTWTGLGAGSLWSDGANWAGGVAPSPGDDLVFPTISPIVARTVINDFAPGTEWHSITLGGPYTITGNAITIGAGGIVGSGVADLVFNVAITLGAPQTWNPGYNGAATLSAASVVHLGGFTLTVDGLGQTTVSGVIDGSAGLILNGGGQLRLSAANTYAGTTIINDGTLIAQHPQALGIADGTVATGTVVTSGVSHPAAGGTLLLDGVSIGNEVLNVTGIWRVSLRRCPDRPRCGLLLRSDHRARRAD